MEEEQEAIHIKDLFPALIVSILLIFAIYIAYSFTRPRSGSIVLPGGVTYLGPSPTPTKQLTVNSKQLTAGVIPIPDTVTWTIHAGKKYPYSFEYPSSLSLGVFPNDPYDGVTIFYENTDPQANLFFRIEDLNLLNKKQYIAKPLEYTQNWWKDYDWKGISSVTAFTNKKGLKGYRAKYIDEANNTPYDHIFFDVPKRTDLIIWISGKLFDQAVFDRLVDSVSWKPN